MIKKLRMRLVVVIMAVIAVIMLSFIAVIYIYMYRSEEKSIDNMLRMTLDERWDTGFGEPFGFANFPEKREKDPENTTEKSDGTAENTTEKSAAEDTQEKSDTAVPPPEKKAVEPGKPAQPPQVRFENNSMPGRNKGGVNTGTVRIRIEDGEPTAIFFSQQRMNGDDREQRRENMEQTARLIIERGNDEGKITAYGIRYKYKLRGGDLVLLDITGSEQTLWRLLMILMIIFAVSLCVFFVLSIFLAKWITVPIEEAWKSRNDFFSDASHELKTPLAVISANLDVMRGTNDPAEKEKYTGIIRDETEKMSGLISQMLYLSREEYKSETMISEVDLSEETEAACLSLEALAFERGRVLNTDIEPDIKVRGDSASLSRVIHILADNAICHSPENSEIEISLKKHKNKAVLTVANRGEMTEEELSHIFDRFYRTDRSRTRATGGFGLGLAIAQAIAERHKGTVSAECREGKIIFSVKLTSC